MAKTIRFFASLPVDISFDKLAMKNCPRLYLRPKATKNSQSFAAVAGNIEAFCRGRYEILIPALYPAAARRRAKGPAAAENIQTIEATAGRKMICITNVTAQQLEAICFAVAYDLIDIIAFLLFKELCRNAPCRVSVIFLNALVFKDVEHLFKTKALM